MLELRETEINENVSVDTVQTDVLYFFFTKSTVLCFLQNVNNTFFLEKTALNWRNSLHVVNTQLKKHWKKLLHPTYVINLSDAIWCNVSEK